MHKHYLNLAQYGWDIAHSQAGTKYLNQVRNNNSPSLLKQSRKYAIPILFDGKEVLIAHSTLL
jgi:hypothetical protein